MAQKKQVNQLTTPAILIEQSVLIRNLKNMQQKADHLKVNLRPHIKTHKSLFIAGLQMKYGAKGITASKVKEALPFVKAGFSAITLAYPLVEISKINRLLKVAKKHQTQLTLIIDSQLAFDQLAIGLEKTNYSVNIMLKVDVGLHRCGYLPDDELLLEMVRQVQSNRRMRLNGLLSHAGQAYAASSKKEVGKIAQQEIKTLQSVNQKLVKSKLAPLNFSIGATPTILAIQTVPKQIKEFRPGNYALMDRTPLRLNLIKRADIALSVLATVISKNDQFLILNVGSKTLSSDAGAHGSQNMKGYGLVYPHTSFLDQKKELTIEKLSEEHAFVQRKKGIRLNIGDEVRILPNHSCVVMNLSKDWYLVDGKKVKAKYKKEA